MRSDAETGARRGDAGKQQDGQSPRPPCPRVRLESAVDRQLTVDHACLRPKRQREVRVDVARWVAVVDGNAEGTKELLHDVLQAVVPHVKPPQVFGSSLQEPAPSQNEVCFSMYEPPVSVQEFAPQLLLPPGA